jgi:UrcA family protein
MRASHFALSALVLFCAPAASAEEYTVRISASAYILENDQSVAALHARVVSAARSVCRQANLSLVSMSTLQRCTTETATKAIAESRIPALMAYHIVATRAEAAPHGRDRARQRASDADAR